MATDTKHELDAFLATWDREVETTKRVLANLPSDRDDWKPAEASQSVCELVTIFVMEEKVLERVSKGELSAGPPAVPAANVQELVKQYDAAHREAREAVRAAGVERMSATVKFPTGPGQMGDLPVGQIYWLFLHDKIHHRGQLSVYLRMLGAKVPSIYGGSADEPWR